MTERLCQCGDPSCKRPVNPWARGAKLSIECAEKRRVARHNNDPRRAYKRKWEQGHKRWREQQRADRKALAPGHHTVIQQHDPVKTRRQKICPACAGQPSARELDRLDERGYPVGVTDWRGIVVCRVCRERYAPDPPLKRESSMRSSAGTAVLAAVMHGMCK